MNFKEMLDRLEREKSEVNKSEVMNAYKNLLRAINETDLVDLGKLTNQEV